MGLDTQIKRFFPLIIGFGLMCIAYFQASGLVELLVGTRLDPRPEELAGVNAARLSRPRAEVPTRPTAAGLIAHNIFEYGVDLDPKPVVEEQEPAAAPEPTGMDDPLRAELCPDMGVEIVTESQDRVWSVTVIRGPGEKEAMLRRVGDSVGEYKVEYIGYNWLERSPAVWLSKAGSLCQVLLFESEQKAAPAKPTKPEPAPEPEEPPAQPKRGAPDLPDELASKIEKVSETEFNIDRAVIDNVLENQAMLMRSARLVPEKGADGKVVGIRLFGVRPKTLLGTLGLMNGDRLETINGFEMASPEKALEAYARLRTASKLNIKITRRGKPTTLDFNIK